MARLPFICAAGALLKRIEREAQFHRTEARKYKYSSLANTSQSQSLPDIRMLFPVDTERPAQTHNFPPLWPRHQVTDYRHRSEAANIWILKRNDRNDRG